MRSTATVPRAAAAEISPFLRINAGRTNSPRRAGRARMAMKPTDEIANRRPGDSQTPMGCKRLFHRHARQKWVTPTSPRCPKRYGAKVAKSRARAAFSMCSCCVGSGHTNQTQIASMARESRMFTASFMSEAQFGKRSSESRRSCDAGDLTRLGARLLESWPDWCREVAERPRRLPSCESTRCPR